MSAGIPADAKPRLPRGVKLRQDPERGLIMLGPERVFDIDPIAGEILKRCTGEATFKSIIDDLAASFAADRALIETDVTTLLRDLADKRMVDL